MQHQNNNVCLSFEIQYGVPGVAMFPGTVLSVLKKQIISRRRKWDR